MPSISFRNLVELTVGAIADIPATYDPPPDVLAELLAESSLPSPPPNTPWPHLNLDEITVEIPVHFHVSPDQADTGTNPRLMTTLPSPLVPKSATGLSRFRMTLTFYPGA
ncbi:MULTISPECIES: hypothetical protein [unclassified Leptolyngbya]|uniref:hypothetical protein n=1 Tax=unclassified Leptolyngbya TaxID=2650499 RepID=UPI001685BBA5|nr:MULTISPECIES: hypothetical protein [unclassified Leptolyngbya]MBD1911927.1 hypothetical protein [Leptolyngbya sp. FACHB-8]MBD2154227.1 hypothetical protein [Leptolyngbya sp. FACHB-16]